MSSSENVVPRTTKNVVTRTTRSARPEEISRAAAWNHLHTEPERDPYEWAGELALAAIREFSLNDRDLGGVSAKYDQLIKRVRHRDSSLDETSVLAALLVIRTLRDKLLLDERRLIGAARVLKVPWRRIADALELKSRQAAERRFLQLRDDFDDLALGDQDITQAERVEIARAQRDRRAEYAWATDHAAPIIALALRLDAVPSLQKRADESDTARKAHQRAVNGAVFHGRPAPPPVVMPWPDRLHRAVSAYRAHQRALEEYRDRPQPALGEEAPPPQGLLLPVSYDRLVHELFGLIGHAVDIDLHDHPGLTADVRALYALAGPASPRAKE
ncbi:hypothetical protein ACFVZA_41290 [Streptomyces bottropensis]|uniref:hypothetical protein n=1 Tax=Streptomyces bottropensis TaxID=42235 RepID=UPI0036BACC6B